MCVLLFTSFFIIIITLLVVSWDDIKLQAYANVEFQTKEILRLTKKAPWVISVTHLLK